MIASVTPQQSFAVIKELARGRWKEILPHCGIDRDFLSGKHCPCPVCGGKDRFRFDDSDGRGTFICNQCRAGDGFNLIQKYTNYTSKEVLEKVTELLDSNQIPLNNQNLLARRKNSLAPPSNPCPASKKHTELLIKQCEIGIHPYLKSKKIDRKVLINTKRYQITGSKQYVPKNALIVPLYDLNTNELISVQFIGGESGKPKMFLKGSYTKNAFHLAKGNERADFIGIAEGYADAIVCSEVTGADVYMACGAGGVASKAPDIQNRELSKRLIIFADNDERGLEDAKKAQEATGGIILAPPKKFKDWADVYKEFGLEETQNELLIRLKKTI